MKFFLKSAALLALIVGGKLSKPRQAPVLAARPEKSAATNAVFVTERRPTPATSASAQRSEPARPQVLSVFFK